MNGCLVLMEAVSAFLAVRIRIIPNKNIKKRFIRIGCQKTGCEEAMSESSFLHSLEYIIIRCRNVLLRMCCRSG